MLTARTRSYLGINASGAFNYLVISWIDSDTNNPYYGGGTVDGRNPAPPGIYKTL